MAIRRWRKALYATGIVFLVLAVFFFTFCLRKTQHELTTRVIILNSETGEPLSGCFLLSDYGSRSATIWYPAHAGYPSNVRRISATLRRIDSGDYFHRDSCYGLYLPFGIGHFEYSKGDDYIIGKEGFVCDNPHFRADNTTIYMMPEGPPSLVECGFAQHYLACVPYIDKSNALRAEVLELFKKKLAKGLKAYPKDAEASETLRRINQALGRPEGQAAPTQNLIRP